MPALSPVEPDSTLPGAASWGCFCSELPDSDPDLGRGKKKKGSVPSLPHRVQVPLALGPSLSTYSEN